MIAPVHKGGCSRGIPEGFILEEAPMTIPSAILNGWIYALFGLYDLDLVEKVVAVEGSLRHSMHALAAYLPRYNAGFWSYYDSLKRISSPYYHQLHIVQLKALAMTFRSYAPELEATRSIFESQHASRFNITL
jgi:hypothetical protein